MTLLVIDQDMLDRLVQDARSAPRRRKNLNFHAQNEDPCHRLLNAVEPESYIPPHRHLAPGKDETMLVMRGRFGVIEFDPQGAVVARIVLQAAGLVPGLTIPRGVFHGIVALDPGSVFLEAKAGPYQPYTPEELAPWAPRENDAAAPAYLAGLRAMFEAG